MTPPLRFFVWNGYSGENYLLKPDDIAAVFNDEDKNGFRTFGRTDCEYTFRTNQYGQSAGVNDSQGNELFAGAVTVQTYDPYPSAVVKFIDGGFVFVYKIGNQTMQCSISALHKYMVLVGHQWMDPAELKQRIAQAKRKWVSA